MKMQLKPMLLLIGASLILITGCKKNDHPGSPCDHFAATGKVYFTDLSPPLEIQVSSLLISHLYFTIKIINYAIAIY
jgi:hypothetical protein